MTQRANGAAPPVTPRAQLAILARALHREGYDDHHFGHITVRDRDGTFLTLPRELAWDEPRAADVLRVADDGRLREGEWTPPPSIELHLAFHRSRPGANVLIHHHPRYATIWSALGRVPPAYDQTSALIDDAEVVWQNEYLGNVSDRDVAERNVAGVGSAPIALLANHGVLVSGDDVPHAFGRAMALEWRCRRAWEVEAVGEAVPISAAGQARISRALAEQCGGRVPFLWEWAVRREIRLDLAVLDEPDGVDRSSSDQEEGAFR